MSESEKNTFLGYGGGERTRRFKFGELTIEGFSRAPIKSFWRIPELKLGFDLGWQPWEHMGTPRWFITHTHMDHILALPAYAARRQMMDMSTPTVFLPAQRVGEAQALLTAFTRLDNGRLPCRFVGVMPGDEIELSRELVVTVLKTYHSVPSVGYIVWERRKKLKEEYLSLSGPQIRDLKESGVEITYEIRFPRVAYLGDTTARALDETPDVYRADVLITEMTFVSPDVTAEMLKTAGHTHLDDFVRRQDRFENKLIIAGHFSARYTNQEINARVRAAFPDMLGGRLNLWL
ncbi:MAG: metal-dependent hydrolase [Thermoguttaceae bacterium]|nr:metal-dependent hydrolase [Thermoguttaceae bacterium]